MELSPKTVERLAIYQRLLAELEAADVDYVHSQAIADMVGNTSAQVRRDLMTIGYSGNPARGYAVRELRLKIETLLDRRARKKAALAGVGMLGRAILAYCELQKPRTEIVAAFDVDPSKIGKLVSGCLCHPLEELPRVVTEHRIDLGILTVPAPEAQRVADLMLLAGITGILNFAPVPLRVPSWARVEQVDILAKLETLAFLTRSRWG